jgi:hypothetical protein
MSRRYPAPDVYDDRERDPYARPRPARNYEDIEVDINRTRYADRPETVVSDRRSTRGAKLPDFLHDDYERMPAHLWLRTASPTIMPTMSPAEIQTLCRAEVVLQKELRGMNL